MFSHLKDIKKPIQLEALPPQSMQALCPRTQTEKAIALSSLFSLIKFILLLMKNA